MTLKTFAAGTLLVLAVAACGSAAATSAPTNATSAAPASSVAASSSEATNATPITVRDFKFDTPDVTQTGTVSLAVMNAGPTVHNLTIRDDAGKVVGATGDLKAGATETLTVALPVGTYAIFCSLPGHESLGIKGTLTVTK